ncbi:MAG: hypothetical protein H6Q38_1113 [Chloroflexi bacterium]|nr:hypothetical protein [Chloroflexota bacterium]
MIAYRLKILLTYLAAILVATLALVLLYSLLLNDRSLGAIGAIESPALALGLSIVTIAAPLVAILEALISWLKMLRDARIKDEMIKVIAAQTTSPQGMDFAALTTLTDMPPKVLIERINELILLGRIGVRLTPNNQREYYLKD